MPLVKSVMVKLGVSGEDETRRKLDAVSARATELARLDPTIKVDIDTAAAAAKLAILREDLRRTSNAGNQGFRFRVSADSTGFLGVIQKGLNSILDLGPAAIPILVGIGAAIVAATQYMAALVTQLSAATIGVGAFAAFAIPTFMKIISGIQGVSAAVSKLNTDKLTKGVTDAQIAADRLARSKAWNAIPVALQPAVKAGLDLKATFDKLVAAMRPETVKIFGDALKIVRSILPQLLPIAKTVGKAIDGLLKNFDQFTKSAGFKSFLAEMRRLAGPAVTAIGQGIGQVAVALGKLIQAGDSPEGLIVLQSTFTALAGAIRGVAWAIRTGQSALFGFIRVALSVSRGIINVARGITDSFLAVASTIVRVASAIPGPWQAAAKTLVGVIDRAKNSADGFFGDITARLNTVTNNINAAKPVYRLQGDISDLDTKISAAKAHLKTVPPSKQVQIRADISQAYQQIRAIQFALAAIQSKTVYVNVLTIPGIRPIAKGGYIGAAATGGTRSGIQLVGEEGPELVSLPVGSYVHTASQTRGMLTSGAGGGNVIINGPITVVANDPADIAQKLYVYSQRRGGIPLKIRS
jgi:hypothetical protein